MSVTCQDLLTLKYFERIKLVAGPSCRVLEFDIIK